MGRQLVINRSNWFVGMMLSSGMLSVGFLLAGLHWMPVSVFVLFCAAQGLVAMLVGGERPARLDYNLFLRGTEGLLGGGLATDFSSRWQESFW